MMRRHARLTAPLTRAAHPAHVHVHAHAHEHRPAHDSGPIPTAVAVPICSCDSYRAPMPSWSLDTSEWERESV